MPHRACAGRRLCAGLGPYRRHTRVDGAGRRRRCRRRYLHWRRGGGVSCRWPARRAGRICPRAEPASRLRDDGSFARRLGLDRRHPPAASARAGTRRPSYRGADAAVRCGGHGARLGARGLHRIRRRSGCRARLLRASGDLRTAPDRPALALRRRHVEPRASLGVSVARSRPCDRGELDRFASRRGKPIRRHGRHLSRRSRRDRLGPLSQGMAPKRRPTPRRHPL